MRICRHVGRSILAASLILATLPVAADDRSQVLATVDDEAITSADLELLCTSRGLAYPVQGPLREQLLDQIIDQRLIRSFLDRRKIVPNPDQVAARLDVARKVISSSGEDFETVIERLGYTEDSFRREIALPLAWQTHISATVTDSQIREYFNAHRTELDGTRVSARQIVLFVNEGTSPEEAEKKLQQIRAELLAGKVSFTDAARQYSASPSGRDGGRLGTFSRHGAVAEPIARMAFSLKPGEISEPFQSSRGVHLLEVTDYTAGDLSLEDVRPQVLRHLSQQIWQQQVAAERDRANIRILD